MNFNLKIKFDQTLVQGYQISILIYSADRNNDVYYFLYFKNYEKIIKIFNISYFNNYAIVLILNMIKYSFKNMIEKNMLVSVFKNL